jgi:Xaa-Pro aminopeptidase
MAEHDVGMLVAAVAGTPGRTGWMRYFTGADARVERAFVIIEPGGGDPVVVAAPDAAAAVVETTAMTPRVERAASRMAAVTRLAELIGDCTGGTGRIGVLSLHDVLSTPEYRLLSDRFPALGLVDLTDAANALRQIKSPFELAAMAHMGATLTDALDLFAERARPGRPMIEVAAEIEGFLRGRGCLGGRIKYSLGERPYTIPPIPGQRLSARDIFVFQFVYLSPLGYWYELSSLYSFRPLPRATARRLHAMEAAMDETARLAVPGSTYAALSEAADRVFADHGFTVVGKHTEDCHTIGTDIRDGSNITAERWTLRENMVLALHPASLLEGDLGFFLIDHVVVRPGGGARLSPLASFYRHLGP